MMSSREVGDLIMLGIGGFTPLEGFMGHDDWKGVCSDMKMANGIFWPIPITLSADKSVADGIAIGSDVALVNAEDNEIMGTMTVTDKYAIDKEFECKHIFTTTDPNLGGPVKVLSESTFPTEFAGIYQRPAESRKIFTEKGWKDIAALQLRNPMHRSHEYLAKIALEVMDGLFIHQLVGKLKPGDIPADVRVNCINTLVDNYFLKESVVTGGYPLDMRYGGPREALLHATFRQNFGANYMIIGRDQIDWTFWCYKCNGMASMKTCPHTEKGDRLFLSGTMLRKLLSEGKVNEIPAEFSRPEVLKILKEYYAGLTEKVEVKVHGYATGDANKK